MTKFSTDEDSSSDLACASAHRLHAMHRAEKLPQRTRDSHDEVVILYVHSTAQDTHLQAGIYFSLDRQHMTL